MRGSPLNLNGIRLKATFSRRETCRETAGDVHGAAPLVSSRPRPNPRRSYFQRRAPPRPSFFTTTFSWPMHYAHLNFVSPTSSLRVPPAMFSDVTSRAEPLFAPLVVRRSGNGSRAFAFLRVSRRLAISALHFVWLAVAVSYGRDGKWA